MNVSNGNISEILEIGKIQQGLQELLNVIASKAKKDELGKLEDYEQKINEVIGNIFYEKMNGILQLVQKHNRNDIVEKFKIDDNVWGFSPLIIKGEYPTYNNKQLEELSGKNDERIEVKTLRLIQWINNSKGTVKNRIKANLKSKEDVNKDQLFSFMKKYRKSDINELLMYYANGGDLSKHHNKELVENINSVLGMKDDNGKPVDKSWIMKMIANKNFYATAVSLKDKLIGELMRHHFKENTINNDVKFYRSPDNKKKEKGESLDTIFVGEVKNFSEPFEFHVRGSYLDDIESVLKIKIQEKKPEELQRSDTLKTAIQIDLKNEGTYKKLQECLAEKSRKNRGDDRNAR